MSYKNTIQINYFLFIIQFFLEFFFLLYFISFSIDHYFSMLRLQN